MVFVLFCFVFANYTDSAHFEFVIRCTAETLEHQREEQNDIIFFPIKSQYFIAFLFWGTLYIQHSDSLSSH